jgi:hypothetical protein
MPTATLTESGSGNQLGTNDRVQIGEIVIPDAASSSIFLRTISTDQRTRYRVEP